MGKSTAREVLCAWGIHNYSKKALFESKETKLKFLISICPYCEEPKRKHMKLLYPDGRICIDEVIYNRLISVLEESKMTLNRFTGEVRNLSNSFQELLESLKKD